jgi:hypothetical protein
MSKINENSSPYYLVPKIRQSARRTHASQVAHAKPTLLWSRSRVTAFLALLVASFMAVGAYWTDMSEWEIPDVAVLGGLGAAVYVRFFA